MAAKGAAANELPSLDEQLSSMQAAVQKRLCAVCKAISKKLKLSGDQFWLVVSHVIESNTAQDLAEQLPVAIAPSVGDPGQLLQTRRENFSREVVEHLIAAVKGMSPADTESFLLPSKRVVQLKLLAISLASTFAYTQQPRFQCGAALKKAAELLAKEHGATFMKNWRPKAAASVFIKLFCRRGQVANGWLSDGLQGRIQCDSVDTVQRVAAAFQRIHDAQIAAVHAAGRPGLGRNPTGAELAVYDVAGLRDAATGKPVDRLGTYLSELPADLQHLADQPIVVVRVKECAFCSEVDGVAPGELMLVNLTLIRACREATGFVARLPEQPLAATMELQVSTGATFKRLRKAVDAHDRKALQERFEALEALSAIAYGAQGKVVQPSVGKGGVVKGGDAAAGRALLAVLHAVDLLQPSQSPTEAAAAVPFTGRCPAPEDMAVHESCGRGPPGSRWCTLWDSPARVFRLQAVTVRVVGKVPPHAAFSLALSGVNGQTVEKLCEEYLSALPVIGGELQFVSAGQTPSGSVLGNLSRYERVTLEFFELARTVQWLEVTEVNVLGVPFMELVLDAADDEDVEVPDCEEE